MKRYQVVVDEKASLSLADAVQKTSNGELRIPAAASFCRINGEALEINIDGLAHRTELASRSARGINVRQ